MKDKICTWVNKEKNNLILSLIVILLGWILCWAFKTTYSIINQFLYTLHFSLSSILVLIFLKKSYQKHKSISIYLIIILNLIMLFHQFSMDGMIVRLISLIINALLYLIVATTAITIVYIARKNAPKRFIRYLILTLITVIVSFAGIYSNLYNMYFSKGYASLKIDENMSYSQVLESDDFIYYSADCFFGTSISNVSIAYPDYTDLYNEEKTLSLYPDSFNKAELISSVVKMLSVSESILFIVYISIIVMSVTSKEEEVKLESIEKQRREMVGNIEEIKYKVDVLESNFRIQNKKTSSIFTIVKKINRAEKRIK